MQAITVASKLKWKQWWIGIMGAIISGAAGATGALAGVDIAITGATASQKLTAMGIAALFSAIVSLGKWLQTHPVPDEQAP